MVYDKIVSQERYWVKRGSVFYFDNVTGLDSSLITNFGQGAVVLNPRKLKAKRDDSIIF